MKGHLVIAGGNISSNSIYEKFVELAGGTSARVAIVPTASSDTDAAFEKVSNIFQSIGVKREAIICIKIDPDNEGVNEWKKNGDDFENTDFLDNITGIWFVGGDQIKIARSFLREDGSETKVLVKIKEILNQGAVIGGTSAGAAIMSEVMIAGGTSIGSLGQPIYKDYSYYRSKPELEEMGVLLLTKGLGFFKEGIIDQHFDKRKRIGRLVKALFAEKVIRGYGVAEDTAIIYDIEKNLIRIIGTGRVTIINTYREQKGIVGKYKKISNLKIWFLENNNAFSIKK